MQEKIDLDNRVLEFKKTRDPKNEFEYHLVNLINHEARYWLKRDSKKIHCGYCSEEWINHLESCIWLQAFRAADKSGLIVNA